MSLERNIDAMKYRKSTHLASADVEMIITEKGNCILTIKDAFYSSKIKVNGKDQDGYFISFQEDVKDMIVNSTNRKTISNIIKMNKNCSAVESRNIGNWIGQTIELVFDSTIRMMGKNTGGIRVKPTSPIPNVDDKKALELLNTSKTLQELQENWSKLSKQEQKLPTINALKDKLKTNLK